MNKHSGNCIATTMCCAQCLKRSMGRRVEKEEENSHTYAYKVIKYYNITYFLQISSFFHSSK